MPVLMRVLLALARVSMRVVLYTNILCVYFVYTAWICSQVCRHDYNTVPITHIYPFGSAPKTISYRHMKPYYYHPCSSTSQFSYEYIHEPIASYCLGCIPVGPWPVQPRGPSSRISTLNLNSIVPYILALRLITRNHLIYPSPPSISPMTRVRVVQLPLSRSAIAAVKPH